MSEELFINIEGEDISLSAESEDSVYIEPPSLKELRQLRLEVQAEFLTTFNNLTNLKG